MKVTSDVALLTFRELDKAFGFTAMINSQLTDKWHLANICEH